MTWRPLLAAAVFAGLVAPASASAAVSAYYVQGTGDAASGSCQPLPGADGAFRCDTLRAAVAAANGTANSANETDLIYLQAAGDYVLSQGPELTVTGPLVIQGRSPRMTTVRGSGAARVFTIATGVRASLLRLGVAGGRAPAAEGGNILNLGRLNLTNVRITDGQAARGGGVANVGPAELTILNSLIDNNTALGEGRLGGVGGGVLSRATAGTAAPIPAILSIVNTTIAFNRSLGEAGAAGAGIATGGSTQNATVLEGLTVAHNSLPNGNNAAGILVATQGEVANIYGSIVSSNTIASGAFVNCGGTGTLTEGNNASNREDATTCPFEVHGGNSFLSPGLVDAGGDTDVLTIDVESPAKNAVSPCFAAIDQRGALRDLSSGCDAGAVEQGVVAPAIDTSPVAEPGVIVDPTPSPQPQVTPTPTPTATPAPTPTPVVNQTVVVREVRGKVRIRVRGSNTFVDLDAVQGIPVGSTVDARRGTVEISSVPRAGRPIEKAEFWAGIFRVTQARGITDLKLTERLSCSRRASAAQRKPKKRRLWGKGTGKFRTTGSYSAATVRGTEWLVQDTCTTTLTRVKTGVVTVRDKVKKKTVVVRKGKPYVARARR